jgi:hypothetical protein
MPHGFRTDAGPPSELDHDLGHEPALPGGDLDSFERNLWCSDATLWFGETSSARAHAIISACHRWGKPCLPVAPCASFQPSQVAAWIEEHHVKSLNVAGSSEEDEPEIGQRVEQFLRLVLQQLEIRSS